MSRRKRIVLIICMLAAIAALAVSAVSQILHLSRKAVFPESTLTEEAAEMDPYVPDKALPVKKRCPALPYEIWQPETVIEKNDALIADCGEVTLLTMEGQGNFEELLSGEFSQKLYFPVPGYPPQTTIYEMDSGYYYEYPARYAACTVSTRVSIRKVYTYAVAYELQLDDAFLYLYVSTEDEENLQEAKELLDKAAWSVRKEQEEQTPEEQTESSTEDSFTAEGGQFASSGGYQEQDAEEEDAEAEYTISVDESFDWPVEDGVLVFEWGNTQYHPTDMEVTRPDGERIYLIEEYSYPGHYVYKIGKSEAGTYHIEGKTLSPLTAGQISFFEMEDYLLFYEKE